MALGTVKLIKQANMGEMGYHIVDVQLTTGANYVALGAPFDVAQIPNAKGSILFVGVSAGSTTAVNAPVVTWDSVNKKLMAFGTAAAASGLTEIAANVDLSAITVRLLVLTSAIG